MFSVPLENAQSSVRKSTAQATGNVPSTKVGLRDALQASRTGV